MSVCVCWAAKNKCNKIKLLNTLLRAAVSQSKSRRTERRGDDEGGGGKCQPKSLVSPSSDVVPFLVPSAFYISYNVCFFAKEHNKGRSTFTVNRSVHTLSQSSC